MGKQLLTFGEFSLCLDERALRRGDENISLTPKMYELLVVLVENPDRILEKDFLLQTVWPDSFVEEGNITFNIRQLRKALGDDAQSPIYIETIQRRGYRFIAKVESGRTNGADEAEISTEETRAEIASRPNDWWKWAVVAALFLIVGMTGFLFWSSRTRAISGAPILSSPFSLEKLSTDGRVYHAVLSPDGKTLVYTHGSLGKQSVWVRQLETSSNVQIIPPTDNFYGGLAISSDGQTLFFVRGRLPRRGRQIDIYRIPMIGGVPQKLVDATQGWISASPDGQKISFVRCVYNDDDYCSLWVADALDGKNEKKILSRPRPIRIADNVISPDGKTVAFGVGQSRTASNEFELYGADIETGVVRKLTNEKFFNINYIAWLPDDNGLLITAKQVPDKSYRIWQISPSGQAIKLTDDAETYSRLSLDAKANVLVATRVEPAFRLNIYQTDNASAPPKQLVNASTVSFTPDGKLLFSSIMTGDQEIWSINADGSDQKQLTNIPADEITPIASPDNSTIYFESNRSGEIHIWKMNMDGTNQKQVTTVEGGFPLVVSPDGQWLYYRSGLNTTLRRVSVSDGREEMVYDPAGQDFAVSPDCQRLALTDTSGGETIFRIISLTDQKEIRTFKPTDQSSNPVYILWSRDGKSIAYALADEYGESRAIWLQPLDQQKPREIANLQDAEISEINGFSFSYNDKLFALIQGTWNHNAVLIRGLKAAN